MARARSKADDFFPAGPQPCCAENVTLKQLAFVVLGYSLVGGASVLLASEAPGVCGASSGTLAQIIQRGVEGVALLVLFAWFRLRTHRAKVAMRYGGPATPNALIFPAYLTVLNALAVVCFFIVTVTFAQEYFAARDKEGQPLWAVAPRLASDVSYAALVVFPSVWLEAFLPILFLLGSLGRRAFERAALGALGHSLFVTSLISFHLYLSYKSNLSYFGMVASDAIDAGSSGYVCLFYLVLLVTMVYGPIAAMLVELFPTRIRYTSMSLPYHLGNGWFGGFLPTTAFAMVAATGDIYYGLWYPVVVAAATVVIGLLFLPETFRRNIDG